VGGRGIEIKQHILDFDTRFKFVVSFSIRPNYSLRKNTAQFRLRNSALQNLSEYSDGEDKNSFLFES
jgi:hypothetical protein